jgi:hypothetical protein
LRALVVVFAWCPDNAGAFEAEGIWVNTIVVIDTEYGFLTEAVDATLAEVAIRIGVARPFATDALVACFRDKAVDVRLACQVQVAQPVETGLTRVAVLLDDAEADVQTKPSIAGQSVIAVAGLCALRPKAKSVITGLVIATLTVDGALWGQTDSVQTPEAFLTVCADLTLDGETEIESAHLVLLTVILSIAADNESADVIDTKFSVGAIEVLDAFFPLRIAVR